MKNLGEIVIRPAGDEDVEGILRCLATAFEPFRAQYTAEAFADTTLNSESLRLRLQRMHVLVACFGAIVGTVAAAAGGDEGHLRGMAVLPAWHGSGVATELLGSIERWLKQRGCKRVTLDTTLPLEPAARFYTRNGYKRSGKIRDFFGMPLVEYAKELD